MGVSGEGTGSGAADIAVIGLSCRLPGAPDPDAFWELLRSGRDAVMEVPADRWDADRFYSPDRAAPGRMNTRWGGFVDGVGEFDAAFFGVSPREAAEMDPQQRLALELGWEALERSGVDPSSLAGTRTGVFAGAIWDDYATLRQRAGVEAITQHTVTGSHRGVIANRLSYTLGLRGPSLVIDSGQSSSLVAVHLACESLRRGESTLALAGGVSLNLVPDSTIGASKFGGLSPDGRSYTFDARANGYVRGEGGGFVVLKPLDRALADGDPVLCVIRGSAVNNGGADRGMTTPDVKAQQQVLRLAYEQAAVDPSEVRYVELHGTGTPVGDPIEAAALGEVLGTARPSESPLLVGSVKTNIGHLEGAAGIAGLLKAVLAVRHRELPASLNFETPNPAIDFDAWNLRVNTALSPCEPDADGRPLVVGVSSFGMGGTNCHVVITEAPGAGADAGSSSSFVVEAEAEGRASSAPSAASSSSVVPWVVSAKSPAALEEQIARISAAGAGLDPVDVGFSLATGRAVFEHRAVSLDGGEEWIRGSGASSSGRVAFVFPGQGTQWAGMGAGLLEHSPAFAAAIDECEAALSAYVDWSLTDVLREAPGAPTLERVDVVQPVTFAVMIALAALWDSYGVRPDAVIGHSQGEIAAAVVSGALSLQDGAKVVALRSQAIAAHLAGHGGMLSTALAQEALPDWLAPYEGRVEIAAINGPTSTVVAGDPNDLEDLRQRLEAEGIRARTIPVDYASHTHHVASIETHLDELLTDLTPQAPKIPFFSTLDQQWITTPTLDGRYWYRNLRHTVQFGPSVTALADEGFDRFIEVSAHPVLTMALPDHVTGLTTLRRNDDTPHRVMMSLAEAWTHGLPTNWTTHFHKAQARHVDLPTYPFQRRHYWLGQTDSTSAETEPRVEQGALAAELAGLERDEQVRIVLERVRAQAAKLLGHASPEDIAIGSTFRELGCDSLTGVELRNRVNAAFEVRMPTSMIFDYPTPTVLAERLVDEVLGRERAAAPVTRPPHVLGADDEPIAIVGMACRLPGGVDSPEALWRLVADGQDAISGFPTDRGWDLGNLYDPDPERAGKTYVQEGGFLDDVAGFDAAFFGISPREAVAMDPQQRVLLETSWEALERAGVDPESLRGRRVGVFAGAMTQDYGPRLQDGGDEFAGYLLTGNTASVVSGRIAYALGLEGSALTVDTACSSSLVALHLAVQALRRGECDMALAGGVTVMSTPGMFVEFSRQRGLAPDGRSKAFAAAADGTSWSEGAGMLLVERLSEARRNGHPVLAVVRGTATNQDGASNGLTAPNGPSQQRVIRQALADARLSPADVDAVEAHGTGTRLGDPIEAQALLATYGQERPNGQPLWLGSLKSNVGHTQAAAGVAGVIKMVMAMRHGVLPKTLHVDEPTPQVDWTAGEVTLLTETRDWQRREDGTLRRAGISAFGISGTNAHVIVEEADLVSAEDKTSTALPVVPWVVSAKTPAALEEQIARVTAAGAELDPVDVGFSLATGRSVFEHRAVSLDGGKEWIRGNGPSLGRVAFVFPGQGTQWAGMGAGLLEHSPAFAAAIAECEAALSAYVDWSLTEVLREAPGAPTLERVDVVQPATFAVMVALAALWDSYGVRPDAVIGHSQGEIAAAVVSGALSLQDGAKVVALRSQAIAAHLAGRGGMLSTALPHTSMDDWLTSYEGRVEIAAINGPASTVVAGDPNDLEDLRQRLESEDIRARTIPVDYASHTHHVETIEAELARILTDLTPQAPKTPFFSTLDQQWITTPALDGRYWYRNLRHTVQFGPSVTTLADEGFDRFLEVSAHPVLTMALPDHVTGLTTLRRNDDTPHRVMMSLAEAWTHGLPTNWTTHYEGTQARHVDLPTYPFQHHRYWLAPKPETNTPHTTNPTDTRFWQAIEQGDTTHLAHELALDNDDTTALTQLLPALTTWRQHQRTHTTINNWRYTITWKPTPHTTSTPQLTGTWWVVTPAEGWAEEAAVCDALVEAGANVVRHAVAMTTTRAELADELRGLSAEAGPVAGVLSLLALAEPVSLPRDPEVSDAEPDRDLGRELAQYLGRSVALIQALGDADITAPLWNLTQNAVHTQPTDPTPNPQQAMTSGLTRVAA
ncbi:beta-ketoacyl synthase N-terminal-like domain-containing protein, partial [Streptomyces sp. NPDC003077]|uniref:type I polyketide synthase n=1 Tax=Streptomyces sp. NPDC003077 TaxID=3154443 RepID=UPI0033A9E8BD